MDEHGFLAKIGLTNGESKVYLALLELGTSTSGPIITKSRISRSKVYDILDRLKEKGLISELIRENTRYFQALSPMKILSYIDSHELKIKEQKQAFKQILPIFLERQKSRESEHQIRVYHGFEGIKTLYLEMTNKLKKDEEYLGFSFPAEALKHKSILRMIDNFHKTRAEKGAKAKILCTKHDAVNAAKLKMPKSRFYEYRVSKHPFPSSISIYQDSVATFIWGSIPRAFVIISKETAEHYRRFFNELWKTASKHQV
ncbi:hypothetical protein HYZ97_01880 [Candidatus Pacearchaeota archaeon]|nr:hypothetical protein [Candidatus Pacearchaeota archaeon]